MLILTQKNSLHSIFKYCQSKLNFNDSTNNDIYPERIYNQQYNNKKISIQKQIYYDKKLLSW